MTSIIKMLDNQITNRLIEAKRRIAVTGDADAELDAVLDDIHTYCQDVDNDINFIMNSCW